MQNHLFVPPRQRSFAFLVMAPLTLRQCSKLLERRNPRLYPVPALTSLAEKASHLTRSRPTSGFPRSRMRGQQQHQLLLLCSLKPAMRHQCSSRCTERLQGTQDLVLQL